MQIDFSLILVITLFSSMATTFLFVVSFVIMYPLTSKKVIEKYFRPPYFSEAFVEFYSGFPSAVYRGVMFMRLAAYPDSGKKRNLTEVYKEFPVWYRKVSKVLLIGFFISLSTFLLTSLLALIIF